MEFLESIKTNIISIQNQYKLNWYVFQVLLPKSKSFESAVLVFNLFAEFEEHLKKSNPDMLNSFIHSGFYFKVDSPDFSSYVIIISSPEADLSKHLTDLDLTSYNLEFGSPFMLISDSNSNGDKVFQDIQHSIKQHLTDEFGTTELYPSIFRTFGELEAIN